MNKIIAISIVLLTIFLIYSCKKEETADIPIISTTPLKDITATSALSGGNVTSDGGATVITRGVCWGTSPNPTISGSKTSDGDGLGQFTSILTGLNAGTAYYVRAFATNAVGTAYGDDFSFKTLGQTASCQTLAATNITATCATLNGTVNPNYLITTITFEYGTTIGYGQTVTATQSPVTGSNNLNVSADINGLLVGNTYHFRIKTVNDLGTTFGTDMIFVTAGQPPTTITSLATNISTIGAVLNGIVNPNHLSTTVTFEYGISTNYGSTISTSQSPLTGNTNTSVSAGISGLSAGTTYHFRVKAVNSSGTTYGEDKVFTTLQAKEIDYLPVGKTNQIVKHKYYTLSYSEPDEQAEWVAYLLTSEMSSGAVERTDDFRPDPLVTTGSAELTDYAGSGYDRGHLCPAQDMSFSLEAMSETFYLSNMSPQNPSFNRGIWSSLEGRVREWASLYNSLYIVTGPVLTSSIGTIGTNEVTVPQYFYKVILDYYLPEIKMIAFVLPNEQATLTLEQYSVTVDSVESMTGIDFFPALSDELETVLESACNPEEWEFN